MKKTTLLRLQALDSDVLAQALFDLAKQTDEAKMVVDRLTRTTDEAYKSTKRAVSALNRSTRFIQWSDARSFVNKLEKIVKDIGKIEISDLQRFDLICRFFETDQATFNRVDDSSGYVGDVYRLSAQGVFNECAQRLAATNQPLVADELELLLSSNDYGIRDTLLEEVVAFLDEATNRDLVDRFSARSDLATDEYGSREWLRHIMTLASYLKDTELFEITALESVARYDEVPLHTRYVIASNYFKNEDYEKTKLWMDKIDISERFMKTERNQLLVALNDKLGNDGERDRIAREEFNRAPSLVALEALLKTVGEKYRSSIIEQEIERIFAHSEYSDSSLAFLIDTEFLELASGYAVRHRDTINGDYYWNLPEQAKYLLKSGYPVAAICIYRALLDSVLRRGKTPTYSHGVRYLRILDKLSDATVVKGMADHATYKQGVQTAHGRKHSFWSKYDSAR